MGTIKGGFWKLGFILSPEEFKGFIEYCKSLNIQPDEINDDIFEQYQTFYNGLISATQPDNFLQRDNISQISLRSFVCGLNSDNAAVGFVINPANMVHWAYYRGAVRISGWAVQITLQRGVAVTVDENNKPDKNGKYFISEDIELHSPQSYPLYQQITGYIKNVTKPLRFMAHVVDELEEIKPPVRVSEKVAKDLANSWIFKKYEFEMRSYNLHKL